MPTSPAASIGVVFGSLTPPAELSVGARLSENLGFARLWFSEDCFFTGGLSGMAQLLAATRSIPVGLGLASTQTRHPAILAMELAGLARMHPGRVSATVGLGNTHWLDQMGLRPRRALSSVLADMNSIRCLLEGQTVPMSAATDTPCTGWRWHSRLALRRRCCSARSMRRRFVRPVQTPMACCCRFSPAPPTSDGRPSRSGSGPPLPGASRHQSPPPCCAPWTPTPIEPVGRSPTRSSFSSAPRHTPL